MISVPTRTSVRVESGVSQLTLAGTTGDVQISSDVGRVVLRDITPVGETRGDHARRQHRAHQPSAAGRAIFVDQ